VMLLIDDQGEHAFLGALGSFQLTTIEAAFVEKINQAKALFTNGYAFLESSPPELVLEIMALAGQKHKLVFFDPGPQIQQVEPALMKKAISQCDYLFLTYEEACALVNGRTPEDAAQNLLELGPRLVAIKMGSEGSLVVSSAHTSIRNPALPSTLRDSTGAGDAFDAAFVYGIMHGMPLEQTCKLADAAGSVTVSRIGAGTQLPLRAEIESYLYP